MALSGNLQDLSVADILTLLSQQHKTGNLDLSAKRKKARIQLYQGRIISVNINNRNPDTIVKNILLNTDRINRNVYEGLYAGAKKSGSDFYTLLKQKGFLKAEERRSWYQSAAEDLVIELFSWNTGDYRFEAREILPPQEFLPFDISSDFIILEGMRQIDEWPRLESEIPDENTIFRIIKNDHRDYDLGLDEQVISLLDGKRSVAAIRKLLPFGKFRIYASLVNLKKENFIAVSGTASAGRGRHRPVNSARILKALMVGAAALIIIPSALLFRHQLTSRLPASSPEAFHPGALMKQDYIETAVMDFASKTGFFPESLNALIRAGYISRLDVYDFSGNRFLYQRVNPQKYVLRPGK